MNTPTKKNQAITRSSLLLILLALANAAYAQTETQDYPPTLQDFSRSKTIELTFKYAPEINHHPALVERLHIMTEGAMEEWFYGNPADNWNPYYSIDYQLVTQTPHVVAVFGTGGAHIGGAHGVHVMESHIWLPEKQQWLTAPALFRSVEGWQVVSDYVREDLYQQSIKQYGLDLSESDLPAHVQERLADHRIWINRGTEPEEGNFRYFQPLVSEDGLIAGLKFVFPPYQVGPWAAGSWEVDVPASVLYPHIAAEYRDVFVNPSSTP